MKCLLSMKRMILILVTVCFVSFSCKNKGSDEAGEAVEDVAVDQLKPLPELTALSEEARSEVDKWTKFRSLEIELEKFQRQKPSEIPLSVEEMIRLETEMEKDSFPGKFNSPAVKSRLKVFRTFLLQTKYLLDENATSKMINAQQLKIMKAYNAVRGQLNEVSGTKVYDSFLRSIDSLEINKKFEKFDQNQ